jgi:hypothetical protein
MGEEPSDIPARRGGCLRRDRIPRGWGRGRVGSLPSKSRRPGSAWFGRIAIVNAVGYSAKRLGSTHDPELHSHSVDGAQAFRGVNCAALHKKLKR